MSELKLGPVITALKHVATFSQAMVGLLDAGKTFFITDNRTWDDLVAQVANLKKIGDESDFPLMADFADTLLKELGHAVRTPNKQVTMDHKTIVMVSSAATRLMDGVESVLRQTEAVVLDSHAAKFWNPKHPLFGQAFRDGFPSGIYDLEEAAKCFAIGRYAAAVFHLMRVMELGLAALHDCLGLTVPLVGNDRNWGNILKRVREEIGRRGKWPERDDFQEFYALLDSVKDAWRNSTMHVDRKVTRDDALRIYTTVQGFMMKLSARMDEKGEPKA